jgi:serine protease AprX
MTPITINGISLDPAIDSAALRAVSPDSGDASRSNYVLVQVRGPLSRDERQQLDERGARIQEYVSEDTYLCGFSANDLDLLRGLPFVAWSDVFLRVFKIAPALRGVPSPAEATTLSATVGPSASRRTREVDVLFHTDVDPYSGQLRTRVAAAARLSTEALQTGRRKMRFAMQERYLDDVAALDEVRQIEEVGPAVLGNNIARSIIDANVVVSGTTYQGAGEVIAVADTGFDKGSTTSVHPAFTGRVVKLYALGRTTPAKTDDPNGHGTHVAGSALGDGTSPSMGGAIQGTAPRASLVLQSMLDTSGNLGGIPSDLHDLFEPPYNSDGARVHTNSWYRYRQPPDPQPSYVPLPYDSGAREIDDVVWTLQDLVICFCAGNQGVDVAPADGVVESGSIGSVSVAKNCITVGASESTRQERITYGSITNWQNGQKYVMPPIAKDDISNNPSGMAAFSSRGPTPEGRIKPDVVAPGTCILSTRSRALVTPPTTFGSSSDSNFFLDSGTSMATPLVAGCAAVLRETLVKNGVATPSAALIKALLINGAVELTGQYTPSEAGVSPNNNSGWGRVDLAGSVILPGPNPDGGFGEGGPLSQGQSDTFPVDIPKRPPQHPGSAARVGGSSGGAGGGGSSGGAGGGVTFKITLVWSDPAGPALQNDLDLIVVAADGTERHGNMGTSSGFDRANNVEQVVWDNMPAGTANITVTAFRITQFAQPYAYAWRIS